MLRLNFFCVTSTKKKYRKHCFKVPWIYVPLPVAYKNCVLFSYCIFVFHMTTFISLNNIILFNFFNKTKCVYCKAETNWYITRCLSESTSVYISWQSLIHFGWPICKWFEYWHTSSKLEKVRNGMKKCMNCSNVER